ncbi:complement C1q subcomponent subunit A-like [Dunckerocampus dactyliophorus]|uniref:complement C1q subcomponent subunit A-like n=1 Tax=Dunckerocampus dactyliophorus TaxID=161453 RepID=UPI0024052849|nr:complement C1q subcomponent subunit A-like [Dunckerocampus dactyliophorus]
MTAETTNTKTIQDLTTRVDKLDAMSDKRKVWFAAVGGDTKTSDDKVIFGGVLTNECNAYDANTGIFTTPYRGAYFFTVSYLSVGKKIYLEVYKEKKDGHKELLSQLFDTAYNTGNYYMASSSRMVDLEDGEKVYVYAGSGHELTDSWSNMFSGFLVYPM